MLPYLALVASAVLFAGSAQAQNYPARPVRVIVPYPPGGGADIVVRAFHTALTEKLGQPIVIDNRPGATGAIGAELAAHSAPDGYTLLAHTSAGLTIAPHVYAKPRFDSLKDFTPVTQVTSSPFVLVVHPKIPATSVQQLIAFAKSKPGELNYASSGNGSSSHLGGLLLCKLAGINMVHIPYKGAGPATTDILAGQVQTRFSAIPPAMPHVKSGRLRALATTGATRFALLPDLPTVTETLPGVVIDSWLAVLVPAGTAPGIVRTLNAAIAAALQTPEAKAKLRSDGVEPVGSTPQAMAELLKSDLARWGPLVRESGAKAE